MCGRMSFSFKKEGLKKKLPDIEINFEPIISYNVCPTQAVHGVAQGKKQLGLMTWGFPAYGSGKLLINARSETVFEKASFKYDILPRRCLIIADSFYEWKREGKDKMPYRILWKNQEEPLVFGGIYKEKVEGGMLLQSCVILTTEPNAEMSTVHNRAPVLLQGDDQMEWLENIPASRISELMRPLPDDSLHIYKVSNAVNKRTNNYPELHRELPEQPTLF